MKRLIWNRPDGSCRTTVFAPNFEAQAARLGKTPAELRDETIAKIKATRLDLAGLTPVEVDEAEIDEPLSFGREVWGHDANLDMLKARATRTDQVRIERDQRLAAEDIELMKAEEGGNTGEASRIKTKKAALRDLPATIQPDLDAITTPEALEAYEPAWPV